MFGAIGAGLGLVGNLFKTGLGISQMIKGGKMNPIRPDYNIPEEVQQALALRQANLNSRSPGAVRAEQNIQQNQASNLANIRQGANSGAQLLASAGMSQARSNQAYNNLAAQEGDDYQRRLAGLEGAQSQMAQYRDKQWDYNEFQPYMNDVATKSALMQGGLTNTYNGLMDMGNMASKAHFAGYGQQSQDGQQLNQYGNQYFRNRFAQGGFQGGLMNFASYGG